MKYSITYPLGEGESCIEVENVKRIFYDNEMVVFFDDDNEPLFILKHSQYYIERL